MKFRSKINAKTHFKKRKASNLSLPWKKMGLRLDRKIKLFFALEKVFERSYQLCRSFCDRRTSMTSSSCSNNQCLNFSVHERGPSLNSPLSFALSLSLSLSFYDFQSSYTQPPPVLTNAPTTTTRAMGIGRERERERRRDTQTEEL